MITRRTLLAGLAAAPVAAPAVLRAQTYPARPIRLVVPFAAGGGTDVLARFLANGMSSELGQQVVVENRAGAGGNLAVENVINAAGDGYSLLMGTSGNMAVNRHLYKGQSFDSLRDLMPVSLVFSVEHVLAIAPNLPVQNVAQLVALAKEKPGALTFGSAGSGSMIHLYGELFRMRTGVDILHVPYRGGALAMNDLVSGALSMVFDSLPSAEPQIRGGRVRALATCGQQRHPLLPDLPTMMEAGVPDYRPGNRGGIFAPLRTPPAVIATLNQAIARVIAQPAFKTQLAGVGADAEGSAPEALGRMMTEESAVWERVIAEGKITAG